jgi:ureidoglycolate lyase
MSDSIERLRIQILTREAYGPFGWVLGAAPDTENPTHFDSERTTFWHEHDFDVGEGGVVQFVWVRYKRRDFTILHLESHRLTEQTIVPVTGQPIIHVVCPPPDDPMAPDIVPDLGRMEAFLLDGSKGVCMKPGCWHAHFPLGDEATYLMVTRRSTTADLLNAKHSGADPTETVVQEMSDLTNTIFELVF